VVLFPRTWNQFQDKIAEGGVVVVSGKFDRSRNDPQIICESVTTSIDTVTSDTGDSGDNTALEALAALNRASLLDDAPPWSAPAEAYTPAPSISHAGNGSSGGSYAVPGTLSSSDEPPSFDELPPLGYDDYPPFMAEQRETPKPPQLVRIRFHRNGDEGRDRRRLERVVGMVKQHSGQDRFEVVLVDNQVETYLLTFPNLTTHYCEKLLEELSDVKGIEVEAVATGVSQAER
jgi:hypothetical protein